jgi:TolB protein
MSPTGNNLKRLTTSSKDDSDPSWPADGKKIVCSRDSAIYTMNANGSDQKVVPHAWGDYPAFSPGGRKIVYSRCGSLFTIKADGSNRRLLTGEGCSSGYGGWYTVDSNPVWSPNGEMIAFTRLDGSFTVRVIPLADLLSEPVYRAFGYGPDWSPDGTQITCTCWCYEDTYSAQDYVDIHKVNADGTGDTRLTADPANDSMPAFSPDGGKIIFASDRDGDNDL